MAAEAPAPPKQETWLDWLPPGVPEPAVLSRDEVLDRLREMRVDDATTRSLRGWEYGGVLPRPVRRKHEGLVRAVYPDWYPNLVFHVRQMQHMGLPLREIADIVREDLEAYRSTGKTPGRTEDVHDVRPSPTLLAELERLAQWYGRAGGIPVSKISIVLTVEDEHGNTTEYPSPLFFVPAQPSPQTD